MEKTTKHSRKSLSLNRVKNKLSSPQGRGDSIKTVKTKNHPKKEEVPLNQPQSPAVVSICSDRRIQCTPPHGKPTLDDSVHYSPKLFDLSLSPSQLLSQTLAIDSPEVGWRWGRRTGLCGTTALSTSPDSAYAADSSFLSIGSSSAESAAKKTQRLHSFDLRREEQRKAAELELRRKEKALADEMLKQRCVKLQEQLREIETQTKLQTKPSAIQANNNESTNVFQQTRIRSANVSQSINFATKTKVAPSSPSAHVPKAFKSNDTLNDFFNDSASDCLLLEATQQLEPQINELTQNIRNEEQVIKDSCVSSAPVATTPKSSTKEKRSSMYLKFLEDDLSDDWFLSLDEAVLDATQAKKPRTSLQRYKSLPSSAITSTPGNASGMPTNATMSSARIGSAISTTKSGSADVKMTPGSIGKMKRHASSASLSPNTSYRGRLRSIK